MREETIHSWQELQEAIFQDVWDDHILRWRNASVFRGVADRRWGLLPSLNRVCPHDLGLEKQILRSFHKYGYTDLMSAGSFWQLLAMGQQFGLPTRLLDWTYSPLVAAHFVTEDTEKYDLDGAIICCDMKKLNYLLPSRLKGLLERENGTVFTMEMLDQTARDLTSLGAVSEKPFALFFEPASTVNRIANQYALFSLTSRVDTLLSDIAGIDSAFTRIVIPHSVKLEIRDKLDYINISERLFYPGLDGISRWIARRYAPLGPRFFTGQSKDDAEQDKQDQS